MADLTFCSADSLSWLSSEKATEAEALRFPSGITVGSPMIIGLDASSRGSLGSVNLCLAIGDDGGYGFWCVGTPKFELSSTMWARAAPARNGPQIAKNNRAEIVHTSGTFFEKCEKYI